MLIFEILKGLCAVAFIQVILLSISLLKKDGNSFNKKILTVLFFSFAIFIIGNSASFFIQEDSLFILRYVLNMGIFLSVPLLYLYLLGRYDNKNTLNYSDLLHFLPFILAFGFMVLRVIYAKNEIHQFETYGIALIGLLFVQNIFYLIIIFSKLKDKGIFQKQQKNHSGDKYLVKWLFITFAAILLLQLAIFITNKILQSEVCIIFTGVLFTVTFLLINNLVVFGLSSSHAFEFMPKYRTTPIDNSVSNEYVKSLNRAFQVDKVYTDPLINLTKLSKILKIPKNHLSRIINENYSLSFSDLINKYRIEEVKRILKNNSNNDSIIQIAYSVGYNSKSTFNTAFKKITNMSPSAYLEIIAQEHSSSIF